MDLRPRNEFAVFIMDELNTETIKQIKAVCHEFTVNGDFIRNYGNVYHSILTESSNQSAGIQLADYAVGVMYGYLRRSFIAPGNYAFATDMYNDYIYRKLRHSAMGSIMGYGIREVPKHSTLRQNLAALFPDIQVDTATYRLSIGNFKVIVYAKVSKSGLTSARILIILYLTRIGG